MARRTCTLMGFLVLVLVLAEGCSCEHFKAKQVQGFVDDLAVFLVAAAEELAGRTDAKLGDLFPAIQKLKGRATIKSGLDDAVVELMEHAEIFPNGKVRLRDGRSGRRFDDLPRLDRKLL